MRSDFRIQDLVRTFTPMGSPWWVAGGHAIDLWLGRTTRPHDDVDVAILRRDRHEVRRVLAGWDLHIAQDGVLTPLTVDDDVTPPRHAVWCRPDPSSEWAFELLLNDTVGDDWLFRRDHRVRTRLMSIGGTTLDGIPFLAPEIVLLYKAKSRRPRDEHDLTQALPALSQGQRRWLTEALEIAHPGHPWIEGLARHPREDWLTRTSRTAEPRPSAGRMPPRVVGPGERRWRTGEVIVRREVVNDGRAWLEIPVIVVLDEPDLLATFIASGAPFRFPPGPWPTPDGRHPWHAADAWHGHGALMLQRPEDMYAVWVFWDGPDRSFDCWYLNIQEPFRRTAHGYDTQDLELDVVLRADGSWQLKDEDVLEQRIAEGRYTPEQIEAVRAEGRRITDDLDAGIRWWSDEWAAWKPDPAWPTPAFP